MPGKDDDQSVSGVSRLTGPRALDEVEATTGPERVSGPGGVDELDAAAQVAESLAAGEITPEQARARLIEAAVHSILPANASPELVAAIRAEVEAATAADPTLERLLEP